MNSSHFTIHVVGIFIGQGGQGPPGPNEAPPLPVSDISTMPKTFFNLYALDFTVIYTFLFSNRMSVLASEQLEYLACISVFP